ncbi:DUF3426 domain-containing protein [Pseudomonas lalucatii]|nr:DUF3426 domain-containing protein [Pseudomonas lalucatii]
MGRGAAARRTGQGAPEPDAEGGRGNAAAAAHCATGTCGPARRRSGATAPVAPRGGRRRLARGPAARGRAAPEHGARRARPGTGHALRRDRRKGGRSEPGLRDEHLFELDDEPLQLDWQPPRKPWARWLGWGLLNLVAAAVLAGQYLNYHFEELARQDQYRPWFEQLCPSLGCVLPSKVDIAQIKSSNLVVRSHPEFSGALVVDAILYNRAPFTQPFPLLEMRFADINGQLLASRRFKPSEYLAGELAGQAEMPPQTPIHVSLDILDPGTQAVNYSLSFHSPE